MMFCKKTKFNIVPITDIYRAAVDNQIAESFAGPFMVSRGMLHDTRTHAGFAAVDKSEVVGYILYNIIGTGCEITVIESLRSKQGIGGALTDAVKQAASESGCKRLWLITTNDNAAAFHGNRRVYAAQPRRYRPEHNINI